MGQRNLINESLDESIDELLIEIPVDLLPMISGFLDRREKDLVELTRLLASEDFVGIGYIGHRLKGTGGGYGLPVITEIGHQLEMAAKAGDPKKVREFIHHLAGVTKFLKSNI